MSDFPRTVYKGPEAITVADADECAAKVAAGYSVTPDVRYWSPAGDPNAPDPVADPVESPKPDRKGKAKA